MTNLKVSQDVSLRVTEGSQLQGLGVLPQVGFVMIFAGETAPPGWLLCNGGTFSSSEYPLLASFLGTTTLPNLLSRSLVGTTNASEIKTVIGANTHTHPSTYTANLVSTGTSAHNVAAATSNWDSASNGTNHDHSWNYNVSTPPNSNSFSNVPINVTSGTQANVWNSTHGHDFGGAIDYDDDFESHSHGGNMAETTTSGNSHSHATSVSNVSTNSGTSVPPSIYLYYIIKAG